MPLRGGLVVPAAYQSPAAPAGVRPRLVPAAGTRSRAAGLRAHASLLLCKYLRMIEALAGHRLISDRQTTRPSRRSLLARYQIATGIRFDHRLRSGQKRTRRLPEQATSPSTNYSLTEV